MSEKIEEHTELEKKHTIVAQKILEYRSGSNAPSVISKSGIKYSYVNGSEDESSRLKEFYKAKESVLHSWKVRKLGNLGLAEWLPDLYVAKILKQGKFMQTKSFRHEKGFFALYSEEALFLLDIGEIELIYKGAVLSLQDAFTLMISSTPGGVLCSLDEYHVYAHLSRMGYRVQRYLGIFNMTKKENLNDVANTSKRGISDDQIHSTNSTSIKKLKCSDDKDQSESSLFSINELSKNHSDSAVKQEEVSSNEALHDHLSRKWWPPQCETNVEEFECLSQNCVPMKLNKVEFPNLGNQEKEILVLPEIDLSLLPSQTQSYAYEVESIWYQRLKQSARNPNQKHKNTSNYYKNVLNYNEIKHTAQNWSHLKSLMASAEQEKVNLFRNLHEKMHAGSVKPLVHPSTAHSTKAILKQLDIFQQTFDCSNYTDACSSSIFQIRFNVYQTDCMKPFRKTQPGKPFLRVIVITSKDPLPSLADIARVNTQSKGVPVKLALTDFGRVIFFAFDNISIPTDVLIG